jgi:DNA-binding transcriptional LysR family regulator
VLHLAPLLPEFLATYPEVAVDLHLSDAMVDLIGEGFDAAIRLAVLPDSSLVARRLCEMPRYLVGSPTYLDKHGRPRHPLHLAQHRCIIYSHSMTAETWRFTKDGRSATVRPSGPLRVNNGDAMMPALIAGSGLGILPEFILRDALATSLLERLLTPPAGPPPKCSRRGRQWIALAKEGEEVWKNWKAPEWRNAPAPMRREHPDCPAIPTRRLRQSL